MKWFIILIILSVITLTGCTSDNYYLFSNSVYGSMYLVNETGRVIVLNGTDIYSKITDLNSNLNYNVDFSNNSLIINYAGIYKIDYGISFSGGSNSVYGLSIAINNTKYLPCYVHRTTSAGMGIGNVGSSCLASLNVNDSISLIIGDEAGIIANPSIYMVGITINKLD